MLKRPICVVFDADDTLWMNGWQYDEANVEFFRYLFQIFRQRTPNLHYIYRRFFEIDGELFKTWGIKRGRVTESMIRTYREICQWVGWRFGVYFSDKETGQHNQEIRGIGDLPFDYTRLQWQPEAPWLLKKLNQMGCQLCLLTSYDAAVFPKRAEFMNIDSGQLFRPENIKVVEKKKTKEDFIEVSGWRPENARTLHIAVGNAESDILPALEIGENWWGIHIPHSTTSVYAYQPERNPDLPEPMSHFMPRKLIHPQVKNVYLLRNFFNAFNEIVMTAR
jgi:hypothetical protein